MGKYLVYIHTCKVNNKKYVGLTGQSLKKRTGSDGSGYSRNRVFYAAILKYGWNNFETEIVSDKLEREEAAELEKKLIKELKTRDRRYGYNLDEGGFAPQNSEETKKRKSLAKIGHTVSEETREKLRQKNTGWKPTPEMIEKSARGHRGKPRGEAYWAKMHEIWKGRPRPEGGGAPPKPVRCIETGIEYPSIAEAARNTNSSITKICAVCHGHRKSTNKLHFEFV